MAAPRETLKINDWLVQKDDWYNGAGRIEYLLYPLGEKDFRHPTIQLFIQRKIVNGELDLRFPTQSSAANFLLLVSRFIRETRTIQAPSRHELARARVAHVGKDVKMFGFENGVYIFNDSDQTGRPDDLEFDVKVSEISTEDEELNPETLASRLREKVPGQSLEVSQISVATESALLSFFPPNFAVIDHARVHVYAPAEYTEMTLSFLHSVAMHSQHDLPWDYIDRVVRGD